MQRTNVPSHVPLNVYRELSGDRLAELRECSACGRIHLKIGTLTVDLSPRELYVLADAFNEAVYAHALPGRMPSQPECLDA